MRGRLERWRRSGSGDKWCGMARIGQAAAFRMAFGIAIARIAGPEVFALFVGFVTVEVLVNTVVTAGWTTPVASVAPRLLPEDRDGLLRDGMRRTAVATLVLCAALALSAPIAVDVAGATLGAHLAFCASTAAWVLSSAAATACAARFASGRALAMQSLAPLFPSAGLLVAALHEGADPLLWFFAGNAVGHGGAALLLIAGLPRGNANAAGEHRDELARYGRVVFTGSLANSVCTRVQPFVLGGAMGASAVALYGAATSLVGPARVFAGALGEVLRPRLALHQGQHGELARARRALRRALVMIGALGLAVLVPSVAAGEALGVLVFGPGFEGIGTVLPWAAVFVLAAAVAHVLAVAMQTLSIEGTAVATRARIGAAALSLATVWPACAWDGARGAFVAMALAETTFVVAGARCLWHARRADGLDPAVRGAC